MSKPSPLKTTWEVRTYDVWGNARDGYEVNQSFREREIELTLRGTIYNPDSEHPNISYEPSITQLREVFGCPRVKLETEGDDVHIFINRARDGYPIGEMYCTSHISLSGRIKERE